MAPEGPAIAPVSRKRLRPIALHSGATLDASAPRTISALSAAEERKRQELPVHAAREDILAGLRANDTVVVMAETGSGKTTQIPQFLYAAGYARVGVIGVTQPRRVAAMTIAKRVAAEMGAELGGLVGYTVRFDDRSDRRATRVKYITDGMMVRETLGDKLLRAYSAILLDEVHERSVQTDVLCAVVKAAQRSRRQILERHHAAVRRAPGARLTMPPPPLKVVVMSATLDMGTFSRYFGLAPCLHVRGRSHPVAVHFALEPVDDYVEAAVTAVLQVHCEEAGVPLDGFGDAHVGVATVANGTQVAASGKAGAQHRSTSAAAASVPAMGRVSVATGDGGDGDILVFLTGQEEIEAAVRLVAERAKALPAAVPKLLPCAMYAALPAAAQLQALAPAPPGVRKSIFATNIAETSLTVPGVRYVIDTGLTKSRAYSASKGIDSLQCVPVSKAAARQRAGRAGRDRPGKCFRLYTEAFYHESLSESVPPEMLRANVIAIVLSLKALGVDDVTKFDFVDAPPLEAMVNALVELYALGALDDSAGISPVGRQMVRFPLDPQYSRALLAAREHDCVGPMLTVAAVMSTDGTLFVGGGINLEGEGQGEDSSFRAAADAARSQFVSQYGDVMTRVYAFNAAVDAELAADWCRAHGLSRRTLASAQRIRKQLAGVWSSAVGHLSTADRDPVPLVEDHKRSLRRALTAAFFTRAARRRPNGCYVAITPNEEVTIHPSSCLFHRRPPCVLFQELVLTSRRYIRELTAIDEEWLTELAPTYFQPAADLPES